MKIEIMQHNENKMVNHYEIECESGAVILRNKDKEFIIPIPEIAGIRSKQPFYDISDEEMKIQRDFVVEIAKLLRDKEEKI